MSTPARTLVAKMTGADVELGNFVAGVTSPEGTGREAAVALLDAVARTAGGRGPGEPGPLRDGNQDWGRRFLGANGGCAYIDLDHLELCLPETRSAFDHLTAWHAMLRLTQAALREVNAGRLAHPIRVLVNNSDGHGHAYGGHVSLMMGRPAWRDLLERRLHHLAFLAAHHASSLVLTGQGKVGSENGAPPARYQLSQRADFLEVLLGPQTTWHRPLVNTRDEPLAGAWSGDDQTHPAARLARLHVICHDTTLCHASVLLRVGTLQIVLAMLEAGAVPPLALEDPLEAVAAWSRDPWFTTRARLVDGRQVTAIELQRLILEAAAECAADGLLDPVVPRTGDLLLLWDGILRQAEAGDWPALARRLDWALKLGLLERAMRHDPTIGWESARLKMLDHLYGSLDPADGLYWAWSRAGATETLVGEDDVQRATGEPPPDTRAWTRAMLLRLAEPSEVELVDWDHIRFRLAGRPRLTLALPMPDPLGHTRDTVAAALTRGALIDVVRRLGGTPCRPPGRPRRARLARRRTP